MNIDYRDQSFNFIRLDGFRMCDGYTEHGVKSIETNFIYRIKHIHDKIISIHHIDRVKEILLDRKGKEYESMHYVDQLVLIDFEEWNKKRWAYEVEVKWENDEGYQTTHRFYHGNERPSYNPETQKEFPNILIYDIMNNPNMHKDIKENLILNLTNILTT